MNHLQSTLNEYYSRRAKEYEKVYNRLNPIRTREQKFIGAYIVKSFKKRYVLELACGTGYWTKYLLGSATNILATDYSTAMLKIAATQFGKNPSIQFLQGDAYNPPLAVPFFTGAMGCFWFSHMPKRKIKPFLSMLHTRLAPGSVVLFVDDVYNTERGGTLIHKKDSRDTWKRRTLENGKVFDILKNYYIKQQLKTIFTPYAKL